MGRGRCRASGRRPGRRGGRLGGARRRRRRCRRYRRRRRRRRRYRRGCRSGLRPLGLRARRALIQFVMGIMGGIGADADNLLHLKKTADKLFGDVGYEWSVVGAGATQMKMNATGAALGSHVRVGLEDSLWDGPGNLAKTNADQVKRVRDILEGLSLEVATPDEAREMLGLKGKDKTNIK